MGPDERHVNLISLLLESSAPLTFQQIRDQMEAYDQADEESAKRMFERDKDDLRGMGVPIELVPVDVWEDPEAASGYTIDPDAYYLPRLTFSTEEMTALLIVAGSPGVDEDAARGVRKLASGVEGELPWRGGVSVGPDASGERLAALASAALEGRALSFDYVTSGGGAAKRTVDPWALVTRPGRWYLVGMDRDRGEVRSFRVSRIISDPTEAGPASPRPEGFDARSHVAGPWEHAGDDEQALVALSERIGWWALRTIGHASVERTREDGWIEVRMPLSDGTSSWILSLGRDAEAIEPEELRRDIITRLEEALTNV